MIELNSISHAAQAYDEMADELVQRYESVRFEDVHQDLIPWLPSKPAVVLDVGSGSGRDSKALAEMGYDVVSAEPSKKMLQWAKKNNAHNRITWIEDSLPELEKVRSLDKRFDLILVSAVLMHLPRDDRERAMKTLSELLNASGILHISISSGTPDDLRKFYVIEPEEINMIADQLSLECITQKNVKDRFNRRDVVWTVLIYRKRKVKVQVE